MQPGTKLGPYEIVAPLGAGGMGEVYRARDTKLNRDVAIKVLIPAVANDPDRLARFSREAQLLAALNHPNIAHVHGLEDASGTPALVMEFVDGETLADRIARPEGRALQLPNGGDGLQTVPRGGVPIAEALAIARQLADALDAAHEKGIIHRDLKPANIKVRDDGTVKILDFGLAKALTDMGQEFSPAETHPSASMSPTLTAPTQLGVILGTAAYMAPEQARGKPVDKRADIWAFGAVLYEMLTGTRAFAADEISDTLALVLTKEPNWSLLPERTPAPIRTLLRRCLEKDRRRRLADIADARFDLDEATSGDARLTARGLSAVGGARGVSRAVPWGVAAAAILVAAAAIVLGAPWRTSAPRQPALRLSADLGVRTLRSSAAGKVLEISRAGDLFAFIGEPENLAQELYVRRLNQLTATRLDGTRGATSPFFSPDGQWIGYFAENKLKKVSVNGGVSVTLCDANGPRGGSWAEDGTIVFMAGVTTIPGASAGVNQSLYRVSESGGKAEPLTKLVEGEITHRWPQLLDGGHAVIYTAGATTGDYEDANIVAQRLPDGPRSVIVRGGYHARYVKSGHILYMHAGTLFAMPFDLDRLAATGRAVPAVEHVGVNSGTGAAHYSVSDGGTLVYIAGEGPELNAPIMWLDRSGKVAPLRVERANWNNIQFSPDGRRVAFEVRTTQSDIWTYEWDRDTATQLTFDAADDFNPVWSPDGRDIAFASRRSGTTNVYVQRADGTGDAVRVTESRTNAQIATSWHPSGKFLAFTETRAATTSQDLMMLPIEPDVSGWKPGKAFTFLATPAAEYDAVFSPDGRWVAYSSTESGLPDIYVRPFPGPGGKWKISTESGSRFASWSRAARELLFRNASGTRLMVAPYTVDGESFRAERPRLWAEGVFARPNGLRGFDLHPDGQRVATVNGPRVQADTTSDQAVVVSNFFDELRRMAPSSK